MTNSVGVQGYLSNQVNGLSIIRLACGRVNHACKSQGSWCLALDVVVGELLGREMVLLLDRPLLEVAVVGFLVKLGFRHGDRESMLLGRLCYNLG